MIDEQTAQSFYDHPTSPKPVEEDWPGQTQTAPRAAAVEAEEKAKAFFAEKPAPQGTPVEELPEAVRQLRDDPARHMYSPQVTYRDVEIFDARSADLPEEERAAAAAEYREIFADHNLSVEDARSMVALAGELDASPPDEATRAAWAEEAWSSLVRTYGEKGAADALGAAKLLVARDSRMAQVLKISHLGFHPRVIEKLAAEGVSLRTRGKLK